MALQSKSHILYFQNHNYKFFTLLEQICLAYEKEHEITNPYKGEVFSNFIPIFEGLHKTPKFKDLGIGRGVLIFAALTHLWSKYKQEFTFNKELATEIVDLELPDNLPKEVLMCPPFPILYIQDPTENDLSDGWYFMLENDVLMIMAIKDMGDNRNVNFKTWALDFKVGTHLNQIIKFEKRDGLDSLRRALNLYLYLCSDKPEFSPPQKVDKAIKDGSRWKKKDSFLVCVGERIGRYLKESKRSASLSAGDGVAKIGHIRRAHWHHYWTGKKDNQKLILKWVHPVLVNMGEAVAKINKV